MNLQTREELKEFLDAKFQEFNHPHFIESDPISIPHLFTKKQDIEISAFLTATISWGQRITILKNARQLISWMDGAPHQFVMQSQDTDLKVFRRFSHRTFNGDDCFFFMQSLKQIYRVHGGLERVFNTGTTKGKGLVQRGLMSCRRVFLSIPHPARSDKHFPDPEKGSAAKRLNMFLRWMVRKDPSCVDFGIWEKISPRDLICPLDVHSGRVARKLGMLQRNPNDWAAAEELTNFLRQLDPADPVKYDFALFGLGVFEKF